LKIVRQLTDQLTDNRESEIVMAVVRTVLPRKGIIQPKHGDNYEADLDQNWSTLDSLLQDASDVQAAVAAAGTVEAWVQDRGISGVIAGFDLATSPTLTPGLATGVLYAQGKRYAPATAPNPGAAPASSTSYLFYNGTAGFYYNVTGTPDAALDAFLGIVVTNASAVISVINASKLFTMLTLAPAAAGNFTLPHLLGRQPVGAIIYMTSSGAIWLQATLWDATNLYLVASESGVTGKVQLW
jgi:hypothetical protein